MTSSHTTDTVQLENPVPKLFCYACGQRLIRKHWEGRVRPFCKHCQLPIYENPVPATAVVVFDETKGLLLVKRNVPPRQGDWALAGGFMELGESVEGAALRELQEETGLSGTVSRLLGAVANDSLLYGTVLIVGYLVTDYAGKIRAGDDAEKVAFFPLDNLPEIAFSSHREFIENALDHLGLLTVK